MIKEEEIHGEIGQGEIYQAGGGFFFGTPTESSVILTRLLGCETILRNYSKKICMKIDRFSFYH